ncbi:MAG: DUF434 domain-containing protein [Spirochaetales bacterium]|nr:DUF434 domain-containing protein [Spirochaetales bacterium]
MSIIALSMSALQDAIKDYTYLLDKEYPQKALLKLVGDKYRLSKHERNCLFRGVGKTVLSKARKKKIVSHDSIKGNPLGIDWYNVLITVDSYLKGFPLFISNDGLLRDSSGVHGNFHVKESTYRAINEIFTCIGNIQPEKVMIYLDSPISHSGDMATLLRKKYSNTLSIPFFIEVVPTADYFLKIFTGIIASSDSVICDHATSIFDLARYVLISHYNFLPPDITSLTIKKR